MDVREYVLLSDVAPWQMRMGLNCSIPPFPCSVTRLVEVSIAPAVVSVDGGAWSC